MSLFFIDNRPAVDEIKQALTRFESHWDLPRLENELHEPIGKIRVDRETVMKQLLKLSAARNVERARKLAGILDGTNPRLWWIIPLRIVLWPFVLVWRIIKLGIP